MLKSDRPLRFSIHLLVVPALLAAALAACSRVPPAAPVGTAAEETTAARAAPASFAKDVWPVFETRCMVCHSCYDAPCQLVVSSHEGLVRGASKDAIYHATRLKQAPPTRLFTDAQTEDEWRRKGFFSVLGSGSEDGSGAPPLLFRMLALGRAHPFAEGEKLPDSVGLDVTRALACPTAEEFDGYAAKHPLGGMPYGAAPLSERELALLTAWVNAGAPPAPAIAPLPPSAVTQVADWERFLNRTSLKQRITARYLYEHWFLAHLYFDDLAEGPFFRIVRSRTAPGSPVDEIASRRPYDDPGVETFYYRLLRIESTIVQKTHMVYPLGDDRMRRLRTLFLESEWTPTRTPPYGAEKASNPFIVFDQIPPRSRYQFLLDDAQYFVMSFIRGPVCSGRTAVSVIEDHFFVSFVRPDSDLSVTEPTYFERTKGLLDLPAEHAGHLSFSAMWSEYNRQQGEYMDIRQQLYDAADPQRRGPSLDAIWDGDGHNTNALLTVFRNFDNATVVRGWVGEIPETAWVIDFPIFERIYYDLVAGFDVFGNVTHQIATRLYMDQLRMQSEDMFLAFLPRDQRQAIRASWYVGATGKGHYKIDRIRSLDHATQVKFSSPDVVPEMIDKILRYNAAVAGPADTLNRCDSPPCDRADATSVEQSVESELRKIAAVTGPFVAPLPDVTLVRVKVDQGGDGDLLYALVHNWAHTNVAGMFEEDDRRQPEKDTITVIRGHYGSYPNFMLEVKASELATFVGDLQAVTDAASLESLADRYGVRRTDRRFWSTIDWLHRDFRRRHPTSAGIYDLNRYGNL